MIFAKVMMVGWMFAGSALMGSEVTEKQTEGHDWTGCDVCTTTLLSVKDAKGTHQEYTNCLNPISMKFLTMNKHISQQERDDLKEQAQSCTEILLDNAPKDYQVEINSDKTSVKNVCQRCKVYRLATNTLNFINGKMLKDRQDMAVKVIMGGAMLGAASTAAGASAAGQSDFVQTTNDYNSVFFFGPSSPRNATAVNAPISQSARYLGSFEWGTSVTTSQSALTNLNGFMPMFTAGATSVATTGAGMLAVYAAFKLGKAAANRPSCEFACGVQPFHDSTRVYNKLAGVLVRRIKVMSKGLQIIKFLQKLQGCTLKTLQKY